jgi:hypothetical protein
VWLERDGALFVTSRTEPSVPAVGQLALDALVAGPTDAEAAAGISTAIPSGSTADITSLAKGTATVELPLSFFQVGGGDLRIREAQVVYTLTQYRTIDRVALDAAGLTQPIAPQGRSDFDDLLPPVLVATPSIGERVGNPVTVSGTADVFEATVSLKILDQTGTEIARTFTNATCGTGCRGDYSVTVRYHVTAEQPGTILVYQVSAKDGSMADVQSIPVTLTP